MRQSKDKWKRVLAKRNGKMTYVYAWAIEYSRIKKEERKNNARPK